MKNLPDLRKFSLRGPRAKLVFTHDVMMATFSFLVALYLRVGIDFEYFPATFVILATAIYTMVAAGVFFVMQLSAGVWRYTSVEDLWVIIRAVTTVSLVFFTAMFLVSRVESVPRSTLPINWLVLLVFLGGPRFFYRLFRERRAHTDVEQTTRRRIPVLLIGAGDAAELFIRAVNRGRDSAWQAVGLVDEKGHRIGHNIHGVSVLGGVEDIPIILRQLEDQGRRPQRLIVTNSQTDADERQRLLDISEQVGIGLARMPQLDDFQENLSTGPELRPIHIEDLLGRVQATLDRDSMAKLVNGRRVLVTGAGGTIGTELCRQIAGFNPAAISLLDNAEYQLYTVDLEIAEIAPDIKRRAILADVRDAKRIARIFTTEEPELVFHAAALKHVPMVEQHPSEGTLTNVIGTRVIADACRADSVKAMVFISTDKAVNPSSIMGATKRIAESYCQALDLGEPVSAAGRPRYITVRFGNVLGSTGSVIPLFQRQLAAGGPLTVTHPDMTRYFMTVQEAVELVLQASVQGINDNTGQGRIYVLNMGEPVKIMDLAHQMILLAGLRPDTDIKIEITGTRPGEKLSEELLHASENLVPTTHPDILLASPRAGDIAPLGKTLDELSVAARAGHERDVYKIIAQLVPEFESPKNTTKRNAGTG